jgi:iron complex outermembrane receptor protein
MSWTFFRFFFILLLPIQLLSQSGEGKVIDSENSQPVDGVLIHEKINDFNYFSDAQGKFTFPDSGIYTFSKEGFTPLTISLNSDKFNRIILTRLPENLEEIIITSSNFRSKLKGFDGGITVIPVKEIQQNNTVTIAPILNSSPGVFMQSGTLSTNKITIRGIGSRSVYGTSKIRAYYQEIPLTNGSGESTIEDLEINALGSIEIIKGPSSSKYGAGLGGSIHLIPDKGLLGQKTIKSGYTFGSFGLQKLNLQASLGNQNNSANLLYSNTKSDGYRENNSLQKSVFSLATNHFLGEKDRISILGNYIDLKAFIPSSINEETYKNNPEEAASNWKSAKGYEDYKRGLFGLSWQHDFNNKSTQYTSVFSSFFDSYEARPFNILQEKTNAIGIRTRFASEIKLFQNSLKWTLGTELFNDRNSYQTYENLCQEYPPETGSVQGVLLSDFKENRKYFNLFFDSEYHLSKQLAFTFGFNFNHTSYDLRDYFNSAEADFSGNYNFGSILSPKFGLIYEVNSNSMIYSNISHGFSPPTLQETLLPNGLINTNIKPESGWNYEIGSRGNIYNKKLFYDIAIYHMQVKNLLVARRTNEDEFIGVNAGKTSYNGLEFALNYTVANNENYKIYFNNSVTFNDFKFKDFVELDQDYSGNQLSGVPELTWNSQLNFDSNLGLYAFCTYNFVDEIPIRDDNSVYSDKYQLVHAKIGYRSPFLKKFEFDIFVGINNLFNEKYASMLLINATSFGANLPRYYYPGEPRNYYTGINLKYSL